MVVVTEARIPSDDFKLERVLGGDDGLRVEIERIIPAGERPARHLWVRGIDTEDATSLFARDGDVERTELVTRVRDSVLLRVEWTAYVEAFFEALVSADGTCLRGVARDGAWQFTLRFGSRESLASFYRECVSRGVSVTVRRVHGPPSAGRNNGVRALSDRQYEALRTAFEAGYFPPPRGVTPPGLATPVGVSGTAAPPPVPRGVQTTPGAEIGAPAWLGIKTFRVDTED